MDSGLEMSDKVLAAVRTLTKQPIRYIINTSADPDHTGGNEKLAPRAVRFTGGNVAGRSRTPPKAPRSSRMKTCSSRMTAPSVKPPLPTHDTRDDLSHADLKLSTFYHGDGIELFAAPAAHTDGDSLVYFRRNDVLVTGDILHDGTTR